MSNMSMLMPPYDETTGRQVVTKENDGLRPVLKSFAEAMEAKLRKNDHKKSWRELPIEALFRMLMVEIEEFKLAHEFLSPEEARIELVDISNFCLFLYDRLGTMK